MAATDAPRDEDHPSKRFKRTYVACLNCRVRKVKCDLGSTALPKDRCMRCERERRDCVFVDLKKRTVTRGRGSGSEPQPESPREALPEKKKDEPKHFSTMEGALVFLANAAGKIASADERDRIDAREKHSQLEGSGTNYSEPGSDSGAAEPTHRNSLASLNLSSASTPYDQRPPLYLQALFFPRGQNDSSRLAMPPAENSFAARPESTLALAEIEYIGENGILSALEAEYLVNMFFTTMHPFYPHIPKFLHLPKVLSGYPILLCAILTISSRYHALTADGTMLARNVEVHDRLWLYVQRLISQTVWAEASTRLIGTVFAFLLFTEWNPRAIHWRWSDYANKADDFSLGVANLAEPAGLGAMRRSYRMAWMLIGSAVRLAQDMGFMELSSKTFLATHVAEINSVMNMKRRSMLSHSLTEIDLDSASIPEADMESREDTEYKVLNMAEDEMKKLLPEDVLQFTESQKAYIELLQILSVGHESLYGYKAPLGSLSQRQNLSILNFMSPMINSWGRKYKHFLVPSVARLHRKTANINYRVADAKTSAELAHEIERESFIFEFNYLKLYIYSLALSHSPTAGSNTRTGRVSLKLDEISRSAKYIEQAFNSANEILQVAHRVHKLKMLRFMPVRWVTRIVRAVAFIVKCYLTIAAHKNLEASANPSSTIDSFDATILSVSLISIEEIAQSIQKAAYTLRDCSPDELHLCTRYSNVLLFLYSEMKTTLRKSQPGLEQDESSAETYDGGPKVATNASGQNSSSFDYLDDPTQMADNDMIDWFLNDKNIGLDFVGPWTELIEQQIGENQFGPGQTPLFD